MNGKQSTVMSLVIIAGLINVGAKVYKNSDPFPTMVGTFVVLVVLVALASATTIASIAVAFSVAFLISSALLNLDPIIEAFSTLEGVKNNG